MIRVLQVFGCMDRGGSETMIMNLYRNIDRSKIQFDFVVHTTNRCAYDGEIEALGGRIYSVPRLNVKNALFYKKAWKKLLIEHPEWTIIHGHLMSSASLYLPIAKKLGRFTISHSHSVSAGSGKKAFVKRLLESKIKAEYYMACSKAAGEFLFGKSIVDSQIFKVLPNAINTKEYAFNQSTREKIRNDLCVSDEVLIGHVGNFNGVKNHSFIVDVFYSVVNSGLDSKLILVGDGPLKADIEKKVKDLSIEQRVIFTGVRSDVNSILQAIDIFVFPSKFEGLPVSVIEAQAAGLPCIISDTIPKEVVLTDLITVKSLESSPDDWANCIIKAKSIDRINYDEEVAQRGYDIAQTSRWLERFYIEKGK